MWTDDYLKKKFGEETIMVEKYKKEVRDAGINKMTLGKFLSVYKEKDIYMVQDMLDVMRDDMSIPRSIQCGGFQDVMETVVLWFSSGGTKSVLHLDEMENFNCLLDGTKDLVIVDRKYKAEIEDRGWMANGVYSQMDVDKVDLEKYPKVQNVPTFKVSMEPGDCLYIPYKWYHQVNSFGNRNLAVNIWFTHIPWFNYTDCDNVATPNQTVPFQRFGFMSEFKRASTTFLRPLLDYPEVTVDMFFHEYVREDVDGVTMGEILNYIDLDKDSILSWSELLKVDVAAFVEEFERHLSVDPELFEDMGVKAYGGHDEL
ncbi:bifunctional peptidase and arginyl-hydroxylase JMJD5-like [Haliotis asinina]|uniref:bifunctional peptidase and arginyl-hydroxylase JMJD5-like n=1 Tax=Haliotis asinina TaxID=109174 RepID=UPI003531C848